ncbi:MAG TPA: winged helix DNA-binding domain-containing protein [Thermoanaerobaculia bacterium]|nr:winged helix DNA-binding domain-containing protein [Thermoanaerobaculia bacterium]
MARPVRIDEEQALYFRARRGHLAGPGAPDPAAAAASILGAQSQQVPPSLLALSQRTAGRPSAEELRALVFDQRRLVRTWGQRDTVHLYAAHDWPLVVAARDEWAPGGRGGPPPPEPAVDRTLAHMLVERRPVTRSDVERLVPAAYEKAIGERAKMAGIEARRLAAARLLWRLNNRGDACIADQVGKEQGYAAREHWFADLEWPALAPRHAAVSLARRYLAANAPATPQDVAHFFNARVGAAREWLAALEAGGELVEVRCGDRDGLVALVADAAELRRAPPRGAGDWPARLLPLWDTLLMSHADKSWTVPEESERPLVWRKAAMVSSVVLARGRVVGTWRQKARSRRLEVTVSPLAGWTRRLETGVRRDAEGVARHLGLPEAVVSVGA